MANIDEQEYYSQWLVTRQVLSTRLKLEPIHARLWGKIVHLSIELLTLTLYAIYKLSSHVIVP